MYVCMYEHVCFTKIVYCMYVCMYVCMYYWLPSSSADESFFRSDLESLIEYIKACGKPCNTFFIS